MLFLFTSQRPHITIVKSQDLCPKTLASLEYLAENEHRWVQVRLEAEWSGVDGAHGYGDGGCGQV